MTTAQAGKKRPPGRPSNAQQLLNSQSTTLTSIFASTSLDPKSKKKKGVQNPNHSTKNNTGKNPTKPKETKMATNETSEKSSTFTNEEKDRECSKKPAIVTESTMNEESGKQSTDIGSVAPKQNINLNEQKEKSNNQEVKSTPDEPMEMEQDATRNQTDGVINPVVKNPTNVELPLSPHEKESDHQSSQEVVTIEKEDDTATPIKTNSTKKKRVRKRGKLGEKKSVQRNLFESDSREFKVTNINATRFDLSFKTEPGSNAPEIGQKKIQELLVACQDYSDESLTIIPWKESDIGICPLIEEKEDVPKQLSQMKVYLPRFRPSAKGGINYTSIFLGHDCSSIDLLLDISFWISDSGFKLFRKSIQAEASVVLGWFLYGIREINTTNLQDSIENTEGNPQVGLRQMRIRTSVTGKASNIRALGIECDARHEQHVKDCLVELYHSKRTKWPHGIKLRYMRDLTYSLYLMTAIV